MKLLRVNFRGFGAHPEVVQLSGYETTTSVMDSHNNRFIGQYHEPR